MTFLFFFIFKQFAGKRRLGPSWDLVGEVYCDSENKNNFFSFSEEQGLSTTVKPSTFGFAGPAMARLNEVAVGREGSTLT